jgi:RNA polymerase sigma-70 factor (ECF subfamily)
MVRALGASDDAEEATQEVMLRLLQTLPRYRADQGPFMPWALAIAHNPAIDFGKRRARDVVTDPDEIANARESERLGGPPGGPRDPHSALRELIAPLSPLHQRVLMLLYEHDLSPAQAGAVLGKSEGSVRQEHRRARAKLRTIVLRESARVYGREERRRLPRGG